MSVRRWRLDAERSTLRFVFTGAAEEGVRGAIGTWSAALALDPDDPAGAQVEVLAAAESIETGDARRDEWLRGRLFLDSAAHRIVRFSGRQAVHAREARWRILGDLTLKDTTMPLLVDVSWGGVAADPSGTGLRTTCTAECTFDPERFGLVSGPGDPKGVLRVTVQITAEFVC